MIDTIDHIYLIGMLDTLLNLHNRVKEIGDTFQNSYVTGRGISIITTLTSDYEALIVKDDLVPTQLDIVAIRGNQAIAHISKPIQVPAAILSSIMDTGVLCEEKVNLIKQNMPKGFNKILTYLISLGLLNKEDQLALEDEAFRFRALSSVIKDNLYQKDELVAAIEKRGIR